MGNDNSSVNFHYRSKNRTQSIIVDNLDFASYPQMPSKEIVESELNEILAQLIVEPDKEQLIRNQPLEIQWKVICRHKEVLEQKQETIKKAASSPVQVFLERINENPSITNLEELRSWLEEKAKTEDISSFLAFDGLKILLEILETAEMNSKMTKNYHKQIVVLKILENMLTNTNQVINKLLENEKGCQSIVLNYNQASPEVCTSVFEIFNTICWSSHTEGHNIVIKAFNHLKFIRKYKYPFQPLIDLLQSDKNIILIENTIAFINSMIESSVDEEERRNIRFQFISCNLKQIYEKIKEKIFNEQYYIDDCLMPAEYDEASTNHEIGLMKKISSLGKMVYIDRDQDEFEKHILQVINQIEVFEKTTEDGNVRESSSEMTESSLVQNRRTTKEKIDFTNINTIFEKLKNDSMTNNTFSYFLEILNYMMLIPRNDDGQVVWEKMAGVFAQASNIETDDWSIKLHEFQTLVKETRNIEELEEFNTNLVSTLESREEEIEKVIGEKNKYQKEIRRLQKETEEIIKKYQEIDAKLEQSISENETVIKQQSEELKKLQTLLMEKDSIIKDTTSAKDSQQKLEAKITDLEKMLLDKETQLKSIEFHGQNQTQINIPPPPNLLQPPANILPPPTNILPAPTNILPPPPNILPPPPNLLPVQQNNTPPPLPPPINLLPNTQTTPPIMPPPLNLLGGPTLNNPPPPPNLFNNPPPLNLLTGGPPLPPDLLNKPGPPGPPPLFLGLGIGGPPPIGNLLNKGGPPPLLSGLMPLITQAVKKAKEKKKPRIPLRGLMWTIIPPANVKETLWEEVNDEQVELDIDFLEREFAAKKAAIPSGELKKEDDPRAKMIKVSLLPAEKTKNMEIVLGKLKMSNSKVKDALNQMDDTVLTINNIESLINIVPTEEEIKTVEAFDGDIELLGNPERFSLEISKISGFKERLLGIKFVKTYEEIVKELTTKLDKINGILEKIPKDKKFKALAEEILAIGNYLNGTTARGGAYGFQLDALEKINDVKMANFPKKNLLMYIIEKYEKKHNCVVIETNEDLSDLELAAKTSIMQLQSDLGEIRKGAKIITIAMKKAEENDELGKVSEYFKGPNDLISKILEELEQKLKSCDQNYLNACKYLCENPKDTPSDKLIEKIYRFWNACKMAKGVLMKELELLKKEEDRKKKDLDKNNLKPGKTLMGIDSLKMGSSDQIVETLKNRRQTKRIFADLMLNKEEIQPPAMNLKRNLMDEMKEKAIEKQHSGSIIEEEKSIVNEKPIANEKTMPLVKEKILIKEKPKESNNNTLKIPEKNPNIFIPAHVLNPTNKPKTIEKEAMKVTISKPKIEEKKDLQTISPQFKKADVKGGELEAKEGPIRLSLADSKKAAPISTLKKAPVMEHKPTCPVDYLSVLKKSNKIGEKPGEQANNVNYLTNILTDGAIKKKSILSTGPLINQESPKKK